MTSYPQRSRTITFPLLPGKSKAVQPYIAVSPQRAHNKLVSAYLNFPCWTNFLQPIVRVYGNSLEGLRPIRTNFMLLFKCQYWIPDVDIRVLHSRRHQ